MAALTLGSLCIPESHSGFRKTVRVRPARSLLKSAVLTTLEETADADGVNGAYLSGCVGSCAGNQRCFLGKCFCLAGRSGSGCEELRAPPGQVINPLLCPTLGDTPESIRDSALALYTDLDSCHVSHDKGPKTCSVFCYWQDDAGIVQVPRKMWEDVSKNEFTVWAQLQKHTPEDRNAEHAEGFSNFNALPSNLGTYLEVGAGPYTQTRNIIRTRRGTGRPVTMNKIYLAEPNIFRYVTLDNCAYKDGYIEGQPVNLLSLPVEDLPATKFFDTVVSINVIEHVHDAMDYLSSVYTALKPGGWLVFCDRYFEDPDKDAAVLGASTLHPIRVRRRFLQHFLRLFDVVYLRDHNTTFARKRGYNETGYYFVGRKKVVFDQGLEFQHEDLDAIFPAQPFNAIVI